MPTYKRVSEKTGRVSWYCQFYYTDSEGNRKKHKKEGFKRERDAKLYERMFLDKASTAPTVIFDVVAENYMTDRAIHTRDSTLAQYKYLLKTHVMPCFKGKPINAITPNDIRDFQNELLQSGLSPSSVKLIRATLNGVIRHAMKYNNLEKNPLELVDIPKAQKSGTAEKEMHFLTIDEFRKLISHMTHDRMKMLATLLFFSGLRIGEALALTAADIEENTLTVNKTLYYVNGEYVIHPPKTKAGYRTVSIPPKLADMLTDYVKRMDITEPNTRIFLKSDHNGLRRVLQIACSAAGLPAIRVHDLRHSHASLLIDMGFNPVAIRDRLGHENINITLQTYSHLYPSKDKEAADRLNDLF